MITHLIYFQNHLDFVPDKKIGTNFHKVVYCKDDDHVHYDSQNIVIKEEEELAK